GEWPIAPAAMDRDVVRSANRQRRDRIDEIIDPGASPAFDNMVGAVPGPVADNLAAIAGKERCAGAETCQRLHVGSAVAAARHVVQEIEAFLFISPAFVDDTDGPRSIEDPGRRHVLQDNGDPGTHQRSKLLDQMASPVERLGTEFAYLGEQPKHGPD